VVRPVGAGEIEEAGRLLARAFHDGPLGRVVCPDEEARRRLWPRLFEALVRYDHLYGTAERLDDFGAVAMWLPPGEEQATREHLRRAGWDDLPVELPLEQIGLILGAIVSAVRAAAPEPHWHLRLLAVEPDRQGEGLGSALLEHGLRRARASRHPVLLETVDERTVAFYLRNGFEVVAVGVESTAGLRYWGLRHRLCR
jgi:GNAT superfamily N-acetyltransferase